MMVTASTETARTDIPTRIAHARRRGSSMIDRIIGRPLATKLRVLGLKALLPYPTASTSTAKSSRSSAVMEDTAILKLGPDRGGGGW
jgi:hypothetical protein